MDAAEKQHCLMCLCVSLCHMHASNGDVWQEYSPCLAADAPYLLYITQNNNFWKRF